MSNPEKRSEQFAGNGSGGKRYFNKKSSKNGVNSKNSGPRNHAGPTQTDSSEDARVPIWFKNYMEMFRQQVTEDVTRKIMNYLESSVEDEATRARHKHSYFALKRRYNLLENELAQERAKNDFQSSHSSAQNDRLFSSENQTMGNRNGSHRYESQRRNSGKISPRTDKRNRQVVCPISPPPAVIKPKVKNQGPPNAKAKNDVRKNLKMLNQDVSKEIEFNQENIVKNAGENKYYERKKVENVKKPENEEKMNPSVKNETTTDNKDNENEKHLELQGIDTDLIGFVVKMQDLLMSLTLEYAPTLEEEISNFKNLTKWDVNRIIEMFFEKTKDNPELSDILALFLSKLVDLNPEIFKLPDMIISVCEKDFAEKISEKIIFMGSLFKRNLLPASFIKKCIQHFTHDTNEDNVDHLCDLLDIVGETPEFWKIFNNQKNLPWA